MKNGLQRAARPAPTPRRLAEAVGVSAQPKVTSPIVVTVRVASPTECEPQPDNRMRTTGLVAGSTSPSGRTDTPKTGTDEWQPHAESEHPRDEVCVADEHVPKDDDVCNRRSDPEIRREAASHSQSRDAETAASPGSIARISQTPLHQGPRPALPSRSRRVPPQVAKGA